MMGLPDLLLREGEGRAEEGKGREGRGRGEGREAEDDLFSVTFLGPVLLAPECDKWTTLSGRRSAIIF